MTRYKCSVIYEPNVERPIGEQKVVTLQHQKREMVFG